MFISLRCTEILNTEDMSTVQFENSHGKYPKTDYTYSRMSRDRVELAPGQVAVPNMSRRSLSQFRVQGPNCADQPDLPNLPDHTERMASTAVWTASTTRKRYTSVDSSDDEGAFYRGNGMHKTVDQRWWITTVFAAILSTITTSTSNAYRKIVGPSHRYPYTPRRPVKASLSSRAATAVAAPFYWIYTAVKTIVTTTVTTITETVMPSHENESGKYIARSYKSNEIRTRRSWPWLLLLLLPILGYGLHYTYENYDHLAMPNFTDFYLDLSEFTSMELAKLSLPTIKLPDFTLPNINLTLPEINITLPDVSDNLPQVTKTYREYKDIVQNRMADASDYVTVVAESCLEEMRRFWRSVIG